MKIRRKTLFACLILLAGWTLFIPAGTHADTLSATISVDNAFNLFLGDSTGSNLRYIGNGPDWQSPVSFSGVSLNPGDYIYLAGWDMGGPQMFIAGFNLPSGTLLTNVTGWRSYLSQNNNPNNYNAILPVTQIQADISAATWSTTADLGPNDGSNPTWGAVAGISSQARFIWYSSYTDDSHYVLFRSNDPVSAVPLPPSLLLLGSGLLGLLSWSGRLRKQ